MLDEMLRMITKLIVRLIRLSFVMFRIASQCFYLIIFVMNCHPSTLAWYILSHSSNPTPFFISSFPLLTSIPDVHHRQLHYSSLLIINFVQLAFSKLSSCQNNVSRWILKFKFEIWWNLSILWHVIYLKVSFYNHVRTLR
jgi:hypothetical protein